MLQDATLITNSTHCCVCEPKPLPGSQCQIKKETKELVVFDDTLGECRTPGTITISYCEGACDSNDRPTLFREGKEIQHVKDCKCCAGVGERKSISFICGGVPANFEILQFSSCKCNSCPVDQENTNTEINSGTNQQSNNNAANEFANAINDQNPGLPGLGENQNLEAPFNFGLKK